MKGNEKAVRLQGIVTEAVGTAPKGSVAEMVHWIRDNHNPIVLEFQDQFVNTALAALCRSEIRRQRPMKKGRPSLNHPLQTRFSFPGFEAIPGQFDVGNNRRVRLATADLEDLKMRRALIHGQFTAEASQLDELISIMKRYDRAEPGIRVGEALKRQAAKTPRARNRKA